MADAPFVTYVAYLHGLNVGGHHRLTMADPQKTATSLGWDAVRTYGNSGTVGGAAPETDPDALGAHLGAAIDGAFGFDVTVVVRTLGDLVSVIADSPFEDPPEDAVKRYVHHQADRPTVDAGRHLLDAAMEGETFVVDGRMIDSRLDKARLGPGEFTDVGAVPGVAATRRTWTVFERVSEMAPW